MTMMKATSLAALALIAAGGCSASDATPTTPSTTFAKHTIERKLCEGDCLQADETSLMRSVWMTAKEELWARYHREGKFAKAAAEPSQVGLVDPIDGQPGVLCRDGVVEGFPCHNMRLMSRLSHNDLRGFEVAGEGEAYVSGAAGRLVFGMDSWGWTDPVTGDEWAVMCLAEGWSYVNITDSANPKVVAFLPAGSANTRDVKVGLDHSFGVSETDAADGTGMFVFDMNRLRDLPVPAAGEAPNTVLADTQYLEHPSSHNVIINEVTKRIYSVGSDTCNSGLHIADISDPKNPEFLGCFGDDGYVHDIDCHMYAGPDSRYQGREICISFNEDTITTLDVTDVDDIKILSRVAPYMESPEVLLQLQYTHQGGLDKNQRYLLVNDELDEYGGIPAFLADKPTGGDESDVDSPVALAPNGFRTQIFDMSDLENPVFVANYDSGISAADHNLYIRGDLVYEANYGAGLRVMDVQNAGQGDLFPVAHFDTRPEEDENVEFIGAWSTFPDYGSRNIIISTIDRGLFVVRLADTLDGYTNPLAPEKADDDDEDDEDYEDSDDEDSDSDDEDEDENDDDDDVIIGEGEGETEATSTLAASTSSASASSSAAACDGVVLSSGGVAGVGVGVVAVVGAAVTATAVVMNKRFAAHKENMERMNTV